MNDLKVGHTETYNSANRRPAPTRILEGHLRLCQLDLMFRDLAIVNETHLKYVSCVSTVDSLQHLAQAAEVRWQREVQTAADDARLSPLHS